MSRSIIVFCDFDGTITTKDSFAEFIKFYTSPAYFYFGIIINAPTLVLYKLGLISNQTAKETLTRFYFKREGVLVFSEKAKHFSLNNIDNIIIPNAINKLKAYQDNGDKVVIVSASFSYYLKPWCINNGFELLATELEEQNEKITGKFLGKNCYGEEKLKRIYLSYDISNHEIHVYGDTKGDFPMMRIANKSFYRVFN
ncbi:MAG: HAD family hydrolase [Flavobacteriales bacterium]